MPNDCYNELLIVSLFDDGQELNSMIENEIIHLPELIIHERSRRAIRIGYVTPWGPSVYWMESLIMKYPRCWLKNDWKEDGGMAGVWVGRMMNGLKYIRNSEWIDISYDMENELFERYPEEEEEEKEILD